MLFNFYSEIRKISNAFTILFSVSNLFLIELTFKWQILVFLACPILCCLILRKSLSVFDSERNPLKEEELLTSNSLCLFSCQAVSNNFKKPLKFVTKLKIPLSIKCSFSLFKCFFTLILSCEIVSIPLLPQNSLSRVFVFSAFVLYASPLGTIVETTILFWFKLLYQTQCFWEDFIWYFICP